MRLAPIRWLTLPLLAGCPSPQAGKYATTGDFEDLQATVEDQQQTFDDLRTTVEEQRQVIETLTARLDQLEMRRVSSDQTIAVADCENLREALEGLASQHFDAGVTVKIEVAEGTHTCTDAISVDHPQGRQIQIVGETGDSDDVTLSFPSSNGIYLSDGQSLGLLNAVTVQGAYGGTYDALAGIAALDGSWIRLGSEIAIRDFSFGVLAARGSVVTGGEGISISDVYNGVESDGAHIRLDSVAISNCASACLSGSSNGELVAHNAIISYGTLRRVEAIRGATVFVHGTTVTNSAVGFYAGEGGVLIATEATASANGIGFNAQAGGLISAAEATATDNGTGFTADGGGQINAAGADAIGNTFPSYGGFYAEGGSIYAQGSTSEGNTGPGYYAYAFGFIDAKDAIDVSGNGAGNFNAGGDGRIYLYRAQGYTDANPAYNTDEPYYAIRY